MRKIKKILRLNDPPSNPWYEISCYLKTAVAFTLLVFGFFLLLSPIPYLAGLSFILGILSISLGVWAFTKIKIVRQTLKILKS